MPSLPARRVSDPHPSRVMCQESPAATAKPTTVTSPAGRPALRAASGIIESISITSSAPAANPLIAA
jgi:hypothetical protein